MRLPCSSLQGHPDAFAKPEKIVRRIVQPHEASTDAAHPTAESDRIAALLFDLQIDVERGVRRMRLYLCVLILDLFEEAKLIEPQQTQVPQRRIEDLAFFDQHFTPDDPVSCLRIARDVDPMDCELPVFVDIDAEVDQLFLLVQILDRCRREVDVAARAVNFPQVFKALSKRGLIVNLAGNEAEHEPDHALVERL